MRYIFLFFYAFYQVSLSAQVEIKLLNPSFELLQIEVGETTILKSNFLLLGDFQLQAGAINIQISCPFNSYTSSASNLPKGADAYRFNWTLDENNYWNGVNRMPISTNKEFEIELLVTGVSPTEMPQTTDIHIRPIRQLELFSDNNITDDYAQAALSVIPASSSLEVITLFPENEEELVAIDEDLFVTFNENIQITSGTIEIREWDTHYLFQSFNWNHPSINTIESTLTINPKDFNYETKYYILITSDAVQSNSSLKTFTGMHNPEYWSFSTSDFCSNNLPLDKNNCSDDLVLDQDVNVNNQSVVEEAYTITSSSIITGIGSLIYNGNESVTLKEGFKVSLGTQFIAQIVECQPPPPSINTQVFLEGGLIVIGQNQYNQEMRTILYDTGLLPGMTPTIGFGKATPAGHPYKGAPWFVESCVGSDFTSTHYPQGTTDWILVELRTNISPNSTICQKPALVLKDGTVFFPDGGYCDILPNMELRIVIKHRNHLPIISPILTVDEYSQISFDFRIQNSYRLSPFDEGQLELPNGQYAMFSGNGDQTEYKFSQANIDFYDRLVWIINNSENDIYNIADYDLNADVNSNDKFIFLKNNLISGAILD